MIFKSDFFSVLGANSLAIESNNEEEENNPCDDIFCTAGQECVTNIETNEAKCECVQECPYEVHPRRMVKKYLRPSINDITHLGEEGSTKR